MFAGVAGFRAHGGSTVSPLITFFLRAIGIAAPGG